MPNMAEVQDELHQADGADGGHDQYEQYQRDRMIEERQARQRQEQRQERQERRKIEENNHKRYVDCRKLAPQFYLGQMTWASFMAEFQHNLGQFPTVNPTQAKNILYGSLKGPAFHLASEDFAPKNDTYKDMTFEKYATIIGQIFEPAAETEQVKLEFEARAQRPSEHVSLYYRDKKNL